MPLFNSHEDRLSIFVFEYASGTILCLERHLVEGLSLSPEIETRFSLPSHIHFL